MRMISGQALAVLVATLSACDQIFPYEPTLGGDLPGADAGARDGAASGTDARSGADQGKLLPPLARPVCSADGWCWDNPWPQGNSLHGIWAAGAQEAVAVGRRATILHVQVESGGEVEVTSPQQDWPGRPPDLRAVWGRGLNELFAVGDEGTIVQRDATGAWSAQPSPVNGALLDVHGLDQGRVVAVGPQGAIALDGTTWGALASFDQALLSSVWIAAPDLIFSGSIPFGLWQLGGDGWSPLDTGEVDPLQVIVGVTDLWRPAAGPLLVAGQRAIWELGASGLVAMAMPGDLSPFAVIYAMWSEAAGDAYAVGSAGLILRHRGESSQPWTRVVLGNASLERRSLRAISGAPGGGIFVAGEGGTLLHKLAEGNWLELSRGARGDLRAVAVEPVSGAVWAVGVGGAVLRYDGSGWVAPASASMLSGELLQAIWCSPGGAVWVAGDKGRVFELPPGSDRWVQHHPGRGNPAWRGLWGANDTEVLVVGGLEGSDAGVIARYDGRQWRTVDIDFSARGVWGGGEDHIYVVGDAGGVRRWNGARWSEVNVEPKEDFLAVAGRGASDVLIAGRSGTIIHYDGTSWSVQAPGQARGTLRAVWVAADGAALVAGDDGQILQRREASWLPHDSGTDEDLFGLAAAGDRVFAVGRAGTIVSRASRQ